MKHKKQGSGTVYSAAHTSATSGGDFGRYAKSSPKSKMQKNSNSGVLWGLVAGMSAGVVAGLLLAPKDGKTTRTSWMNSATDLYGKAESAINDGLSKMTGKAGSNGNTGADSTVASVKTDQGITNV